MLPFNKASIVGKELEYIAETIKMGWISGDGPFAKRSEQFLESHLGKNSKVFLTPSCTHSLEMCAMLLNLEPGDEVIVPSFTFVTTALAFTHQGAKLVFADIDPIDLNICPDSVERFITKRTKAVVVVHYGGVACDMTKLQSICRIHNILLIEDAAHGLGGTFNGKPLGSIGELATFSFHETKNVTCGEGGALVVNSPELTHRAQIIRDKGTNRKDFERGSAAFYTWVDTGSSYVISDILAAFLLGQLEQLDLLRSRRLEIIKNYTDRLRDLEKKGIISYPDSLSSNESGAHLFFILLNTPKEREELRLFLKSKEIVSVFHYQPLHLSPYVKSKWGEQPELPNVEQIAPRLLRLPLYFELKESEQNFIIESIYSFFS
jgi:dTDP-4-amino-4,6-dideoxygalactose transaminase